MNRCDKCGNVIGNGDAFCTKCGAPASTTGFGSGFQSNDFPNNSTNDFVNNNGQQKSLKSIIEETGGFGDTSIQSVAPAPMPTNNTQVNPKPSKGKSTISDGMIILIILIVIAVIGGAVMLFSNKSDDSNKLNSNNNNPFNDTGLNLTDPNKDEDEVGNEQDISDDSSGSSNVSGEDTNIPDNIPDNNYEKPSEPDINVETREVIFNDYVFNVPKSYRDSMLDNNILYITPSDNSWGVAIRIDGGSYSTYSDDLSKAQVAYERAGFVVNNISKKKYSNLSFIVLEVSNDVNTGLAAITSAGDNKVFLLTVYTATGKVDYSILETFAGILYKAKTDSQVG